MKIFKIASLKNEKKNKDIDIWIITYQFSVVKSTLKDSEVIKKGNLQKLLWIISVIPYTETTWQLNC